MEGIDRSAVDRLIGMGGTELALKMIDLFLSEGDERIEKLRKAGAALDLEELAWIAHPLKSSAGYVGAVRLADLARQVEAKARAGEAGGLAELLAEMDSEFGSVIGALKRIREEL